MSSDEDSSVLDSDESLTDSGDDKEHSYDITPLPGNSDDITPLPGNNDDITPLPGNSDDITPLPGNSDAATLPTITEEAGDPSQSTVDSEPSGENEPAPNEAENQPSVTPHSESSGCHGNQSGDQVVTPNDETRVKTKSQDIEISSGCHGNSENVAMETGCMVDEGRSEVCQVAMDTAEALCAIETIEEESSTSSSSYTSSAASSESESEESSSSESSSESSPTPICHKSILVKPTLPPGGLKRNNSPDTHSLPKKRVHFMDTDDKSVDAASNQTGAALQCQTRELPALEQAGDLPFADGNETINTNITAEKSVHQIPEDSPVVTSVQQTAESRPATTGVLPPGECEGGRDLPAEGRPGPEDGESTQAAGGSVQDPTSGSDAGLAGPDGFGDGLLQTHTDPLGIAAPSLGSEPAKSQQQSGNQVISKEQISLSDCIGEDSSKAGEERAITSDTGCEERAITSDIACEGRGASDHVTVDKPTQPQLAVFTETSTICGNLEPETGEKMEGKQTAAQKQTSPDKAQLGEGNIGGDIETKTSESLPRQEDTSSEGDSGSDQDTAGSHESDAITPAASTHPVEAPLAQPDEDEQDELLERIMEQRSQRPLLSPEDAELSCLSDTGADVPYDRDTDLTDFTADSECTFVVNSDSDELSDPNVAAAAAKPPLPYHRFGPSKDTSSKMAASSAPVAPTKVDGSLADKLQMISQSGVLSGQVTRKTMATTIAPATTEETQQGEETELTDSDEEVNTDKCESNIEDGAQTSRAEKTETAAETTTETPEKSESCVLEKVESLENSDAESAQSDSATPSPVVSMDTSPSNQSQLSMYIDSANHKDPVTLDTVVMDISLPGVSPTDKIVPAADGVAVVTSDTVAMVTADTVAMVTSDTVTLVKSSPVSTLERKRRAKSAENLTRSPQSPSDGCHGNKDHRGNEAELSQQDVDDAVKKLRQSAETSLSSRPDSYHSRYPSRHGNRRRYDWNTHHFFPDIHDVDVGILFTRRRAHDASQYIEADWLQPPADADAMAPGDTSSSGDDLPKVWRKNPLHVRRKKRSERRLSQEMRGSMEAIEKAVKQEILDDQRVNRSPKRSQRRSSNPNQTAVKAAVRGQRRNSDLIQEKVEQFAALQRRRKALESNSEENVVKGKDNRRLVSERVRSWTDLQGRSHSQEDIRYESRGQSAQIQRDLSQTQLIHDVKKSPRLVKPQDKTPDQRQSRDKPKQKSQYDFQSFETDQDRSIQCKEFYSSGHDARKSLEDYRNISSSFENIYDSIDLSMYSPDSMDINEYIKKDIARRRLKMRQDAPTIQATETTIVNTSFSESNKPDLVMSVTKPLSKLKMPRSAELTSDSSQPGTPSSPVWYVPKPQDKYEVQDPSRATKSYDAKSLMEEEQRKFQDYKREYSRRLSERDSGTSGDETQHRGRIIPPDDYEYILRKIHHKRQDAYYAEPTYQDQQQPAGSKATELKQPRFIPPSSALHLPAGHHERSTSQLSTESSRELEQYFVPGNRRSDQELYQQYQKHSENLKPEKQKQLASRKPQKAYVAPNVVPQALPAQSAEVVQVSSEEEEDETSVQDKMKVFEKLQTVHAELKRQSKQKRQKAAAQSVALQNRQPVSKKPPMPKREDFTPAEPSEWSYNTVYKTTEDNRELAWTDQRVEMDTRPQPSDRVIKDQNLQLVVEDCRPASSGEEYGLVFRLTPVNPSASSPSLSDSQSDHTRNVTRRSYMDGTSQEQDIHRMTKQQFKEWKSQEDFQRLKDDVKYNERHAAPYKGHDRCWEGPGPAKTPPTPPNNETAKLSPLAMNPKQNNPKMPIMMDPRNAAVFQQPSSDNQHAPQFPRLSDSRAQDRPTTKPVSSSHDNLVHHEDSRRSYRSQRDQIVSLPDNQQKSWSSRIHEVESMGPSQSQRVKETSTRSFALIAQNKPAKASPENKVAERPVLERQTSSPNELSLKQSRASSQYEDHIKRNQERYRSETQTTVGNDVDKNVNQKLLRSEYVDPTFIRQRKNSTESSQSSPGHHVQSKPSAADVRRSYGLQIQMEKAEPQKTSEVLIKLSRSQEDLTKVPTPDINSIKSRFEVQEKAKKPNFKQELAEVWKRSDRKVSSIQSDVFSSKEVPPPPVRSSSFLGQDEDNDERLVNYVSYKDGQARKRSNIFDVLTDLERTYEQLNIDNEDFLDQAKRREYISNIQRHSAQESSHQPNVKRLSITNVKMLEDAQVKENNPSLEYAKRWIEEDSNRASQLTQTSADHKVKSASLPATDRQSYPTPPSESGTSNSRMGPRSSLPRKVKDDMAYRRKNRISSAGSQPDLPESTTMSYLGKSPTVSPSQSMDNLSRRGRSKTPDAVLDDMMYRQLQRAKSPGTTDADISMRSLTSTEYLLQRTTEPARGRMRLRPEHQADKYHDDLAYRNLRKDVTPIVAELPDAYYRMTGNANLRTRSRSLDRSRKSREVTRDRDGHSHQRSQSLGRSPQAMQERRTPPGKGVAQMVQHFSHPVSHTQSAPNLTDQAIFAEDYNAQGDLVSDDPKYGQYAQKPKKQQTPRTVKMRHELKSKMRQMKHSADSGYMEQSESDASHSSSGPDSRGHNLSPQEDSNHDIRFMDANDGREVKQNVQKFKSQYAVPQQQFRTSEIKFIDEERNHEASSKTLPPHTFVLQIPDKQGKENPKTNTDRVSRQKSLEEVFKQRQMQFHNAAQNRQVVAKDRISTAQGSRIEKTEQRHAPSAPKPSPPVRQSSLTNEMPVRTVQDRASHRIAHHPVNSESRKSWHGPTALKDQIEITQPATIETQATEDLQQELKQRYRRSWHEPALTDSDHGQQVKVEFAFKAPAGELPQAHTKNVEPQKEQVRYLSEANRRQIPSNQVLSEQKQKVNPIESQRKPQFELPVIHSKPQNQNVLSRMPSSGQAPSYTVAPITKKAKVSDQQVPVTKDLQHVINPQQVAPTSPKRSQIELTDVKSVVQPKANDQNPTQHRTTQIQMVSSSHVPTDQREVQREPPKHVTSKAQIKPSSTDEPKHSVTTFSRSEEKSDANMSESSSQHKVVTSKTFVKQSGDVLEKRQLTVSQKEVSSRQQRVFKMSMPVGRQPRSSMLSPPLDPLDRLRLSPGDRGFLSPPPRRSLPGYHSELSDGEMTDATDITLDGLVRSNQVRPFSPETLNFSDFFENVSDSGESNSGNSQMMADGRSKRVKTPKESTGKTVTKKVMVKESSQTITSKKTTTQDDRNQPSFKDLLKSFESKVSPYMKLSQDSKQQPEVDNSGPESAPDCDRPRLNVGIRQMSGSDPNLRRSGTAATAPESPKWRRM